MGAFVREYPLTAGLILLNLLAYLASALCAGTWGSIDTRTLLECGGVYGPAVLEGGEWWRLLSAMFLHGGAEHLAMNMVSLFIVGRIMESYFPREVYLMLYLAAGLVGFCLSLLTHPASVSIGASGAIFGLFGAIGGFALFHRQRLGARYRTFMKEFGAILGLNLLFGLLVPGIDMSAHLGGLVLGFVGGYLAARSLRAVWIYLVGTVLVVGWWLRVGLPERMTMLPLQ